MSEKIKLEYEPYEHKGMRISFNGMVTQTMNQLRVFEKISDDNKDEYGEFERSRDFDDQIDRAFEDMTCNYSYTLQELLDHFKILGDAFYSGDLRTVDNVLQLWCLKPEEDNV